MNATIFGILACLLYLVSAGAQLLGLRREVQAKHLFVSLTGLGAIVLHGLFSFS